jgi:hypothetical protein
MRIRKNRKSQMEIMGLAIIFVLVILGVLFAIRFVLTKPETGLREGYIESRLAYNMVNAVRGVSTDCHGATMERLVQDCAATMAINCKGMTSCDYAEQEIGKILMETLDVWGKDFEFTVTGHPRVEGITFNNTRCRGELEAETQPIATKSGTVIMKLVLC